MADADDEEWAVSVSELDEEPATLEPGDVSLEHAAFVLLGAAATVLAFAQVVL